MPAFDAQPQTARASAAFDGRFDAAREMIKTQQHRCEEPLCEGGRWPVSVLLLPDPMSSVAVALDRLLTEAVGLAGPEHWRTGRPGTSHLTVRALEWRRNQVLPDDLAVRRYAAAMTRAAAACGPLSFRVQGLTVTPGTVMAVATPTDDQPERLLDLFADELGDDRWLEASIGRRDIWYLNLLHFAGPIADPDGLLGWVDSHREMFIGMITIDECRLIRWDYRVIDGRYDLRPVTLAASTFTQPNPR